MVIKPVIEITSLLIIIPVSKFSSKNDDLENTSKISGKNRFNRKKIDISKVENLVYALLYVI